MQSRYGAEVELVGGVGGVFDVEVEGELLFSKHQQGRYPTLDEIDRLIGER
jgi:selenoprotein W-related protein